MTPALTVHADADAVAQAAGVWLCSRLSAETGNVAVALSGGSTPARLYELLAEPECRDRVPWARVHWFFGDEHFVPPDDPRSNFALFQRTVLAHVPVPDENVHPIPTVGVTPDRAADSYAQELQRYYGATVLGADRPLFDVVLLGLGEDGHTASLLPGSAALEERSTWVTAVVDARPEPRISLTYPALESCRNCLFLVAGSAKKAILGAVLRGEDYPATRLRTRGECIWFVDRAAAPDGAAMAMPSGLG